MPAREILRLGNPALYERCAPVRRDEIDDLLAVVRDMHDTLFDFRARHGAGRAIAAPQIGVSKRLVYMHVGGPKVFVNPEVDELSEQRFELWDDCMSFPELLVRVKRHRTCRVTWRDMEWTEHRAVLADGFAELLQHECDHLDGILAVSRATGPAALALRDQVDPEQVPRPFS